MFSGIVERKGIIKSLDLKEKWGRIAIDPRKPWDHPVEIGESIAISGICLTVTDVVDGALHFDVLRETFERTTLGYKQPGQFINMERSLRWGQEMGGHIVVGHVDGVATVENIREVGRDWSFEFSCSDELFDGVVYKGSVGIDGVSLTVAELTKKTFSVHIIPFTYEQTTFGELKKGTLVNLEIDLLGKYARRLLERGRVPGEVTWDSLRETGLI
ncbi:MAG: riboflavin synthase [Kiritimatiellae bacterium]|nr:riboflavin synthase [Kiritimatiellia bacterium]MDD4734986.1 riboflavin synthase [Kiritimatiellia bacterium]